MTIWYWALIAPVLLLAAVPLMHKWEKRQDERDRKAWEAMWR